MNYGDLIIRVGFGLLFIWGGLEKFFEGFVGGVGLQKMASSLGSLGWGFLGDTGTLALAAFLALAELVAGVLMILGKKLFLSYVSMSFVMFVALVTVYIPAGSWMNSMIHIALTMSLLGLGLNQYEKGKSIWQQK